MITQLIFAMNSNNQLNNSEYPCRLQMLNFIKYFNTHIVTIYVIFVPKILNKSVFKFFK